MGFSRLEVLTVFEQVEVNRQPHIMLGIRFVSIFRPGIAKRYLKSNLISEKNEQRDHPGEFGLPLPESDGLPREFVFLDFVADTIAGEADEDNAKPFGQLVAIHGVCNKPCYHKANPG